MKELFGARRRKMERNMKKKMRKDDVFFRKSLQCVFGCIMLCLAAFIVEEGCFRLCAEGIICTWLYAGREICTWLFIGGAGILFVAGLVYLCLAQAEGQEPYLAEPREKMEEEQFRELEQMLEERKKGKYKHCMD